MPFKYVCLKKWIHTCVSLPYCCFAKSILGVFSSKVNIAFTKFILGAFSYGDIVDMLAMYEEVRSYPIYIW